MHLVRKASELRLHIFSAQPFSSELYMILSGPKLHALVLGDLAFHLLRPTTLRAGGAPTFEKIAAEIDAAIRCCGSTHRVRHIPRACVPSSSIDIAELCGDAQFSPSKSSDRSAEGKNVKFDRPGTQRRIDMIRCSEESGARNLSYISDRYVFALEIRAKRRPIQDHRHWTFLGTISSQCALPRESFANLLTSPSHQLNAKM